MLGNINLFEICKEYYPGLNLDNLDYKIEKFGDLERIEIWLNDHSPIYCLCDRNYMHWYGDHGSFSFDCTWKPSVRNLPYNSPSYMFEKLDQTAILGAGKEFNATKARKAILDHLFNSSWWEEEVLEEDKPVIKDLFECDYIYYISIWGLETQKEYNQDMLEQIAAVLDSSSDQFDLINRLRDLDDANPLFDDDYSLYYAGEVISPHFYLIFYALSVVADLEIKKEEKSESN